MTSMLEVFTVSDANDGQEVEPTPSDELEVDPAAGVTTPTSKEETQETLESPLHSPQPNAAVNGTILEAAFVDPAFADKEFDKKEGSSSKPVISETGALLKEGESSPEQASSTTTSRKVTTTTETETACGWLGFKCCKSKDAVVGTHSSKAPTHTGLSRRERKKMEKYNKVPQGILIYRLDTSSHTVELVSTGSGHPDILEQMTIATAAPSLDKTRRGIVLTGIDGSTNTLVACEQRTAIAWLEAIDMMLASKSRRKGAASGNKVVEKQQARQWGKERLNEEERDQIESQYLNLAAYSNKLIRAGGVKGGASIYYSVNKVHHNAHNQMTEDDEALESIAKRRAVIKDSWDFYRMICSLLRDRRKYDEVFRKMQLDPVYPYLNSMTGLNDPGDDGLDNADKQVVQKDLPEYASMGKSQVAKQLIEKANEALPSLVEICKALAGSLGMEEVGVGPVKEVGSAIRKADKKYGGDLLKVTDYCRALLVVKDVPSLLALLELARDSFGPLIRRVKLSSLKKDRKPIPGGYRDCKINVELKEHICEIQVHLWPMWTVCGVDGFRHYRHCLEYSTDSFGDPYEALDGLDRKTMAELIVMSEEAVAAMPLDNLEWFQEKFILDYFAEVGLFLHHGLEAWAEVTLRRLIELRIESPDIGPEHHETLILQKYLVRALKGQGKKQEAEEVSKLVKEHEEKLSEEKKEAEASLWDSFLQAPTDLADMVMDPNKKEREEEEKMKKEVKASKKQWRKIRQERFAFLDSNNALKGQTAGEHSAQGKNQGE